MSLRAPRPRSARRLRVAAATGCVALAALVAGACGGENGEAVEEAVTNVPETVPLESGDVERLEEELDELERVIRDDLSGLSDARSLDDVRAALEGTRSQLEESASELREIDVSDADVAEQRDALEAAVRDLSAQLEEAENAVAEEDLAASLRETAAAIEDRERVDDALAELRNRLEQAGE